MSDVKNTVTENQNAEAPVVTDYKITVEEHEAFDSIVETAFVTSTEFCRKITDLFKVAFSDCIGSSMDIIPGTNMHVISLYFDHLDHGDQVTAVSRDAGDQKTMNSLLRSTRNYSRKLVQGDKYNITEEGKSALADFLMSPDVAKSIYNNTCTEIKWDKIAQDVTDPSYTGLNMNGRQLTKISFIDPEKLALLIYGDKNVNDSKVLYRVRNLGSLPVYNNGYSAAGYSLAIDRVVESNVLKMSNAYGMGYNNGLNIVR